LKSISGKAAEETHFAPIFEHHCLIVGKILKNAIVYLKHTNLLKFHRLSENIV